MNWTFYYNEESNLHPIDTIGKYLFFGSSKELLLSLGQEIMRRFDLPMMKIPESDIPNDSPGFEYVLAIYDSSDRYKYQIKGWLGRDDRYESINYRYFKTNKATEMGNYSHQFKQSKAYGNS